MITYILFLVGFVVLIKGADLLVDGSSAIAKRFNVSSFVIGLTIVAFGTSMPELIINIFSSVEGASEIAIGNIIGSNITNIMLILGIAAFIYPLTLEKGTVWRAIPLSLLAAIMVLILSNDKLIENRIFSELSRIDGLVLISFFIIFLYYTFGIKKVQSEEVVKIESLTFSRAIIYICLGLIGLMLGGKWIVDGAIFIANQLNISQALIGLTIIAIGTGLPELTTSAVAAYKKKVDIAMGNVIGSNIFNIFWVLGISAMIRPLQFNIVLNYDIIFLIFASLLIFLFMFLGKKHVLEKWQGFTLII
ncbi:calcium/sodium antiporter, partial [Candidatus Falkowbacteria bacterium]|nr:calcium/sodium antiporter [Candidatus Falkowbacteria bacterium]